MKPLKDFEYSNARLIFTGRPPYPEGVIDIGNLDVWTDEVQCVSCWRMSWRERLSALLFGRVWVAVLSGKSQPPMYVEATRQYLEVANDSQ